MEAIDLPTTTSLDVSSVNTPLFISIQRWLKKHGKNVRPKLTEQQKQELQECFKLMDEDGSGAIDVDELGSAFKLLGIRLKKAEIEALVNEVDHDGTGELEYPEFLEIMTDTLHRLSEEPETLQTDTAGGGDVRPPFALMATAYRRKKLLEGIMEGGKSALDQIVASAEEAEKEKERSARLLEAQNEEAARNAHSDKPSNRLKKAAQTAQIDASLLSDVLSPAELKLVTEVAVKCGMSKPSGSVASAGYEHQTSSAFASLAAWRRSGTYSGTSAGSKADGGGQYPGLGSEASWGAGSPRALPPIRGASPRFTDTARHQQLLEVPKMLEKPLVFMRAKKEAPAPVTVPVRRKEKSDKDRDAQQAAQQGGGALRLRSSSGSSSNGGLSSPPGVLPDLGGGMSRSASKDSLSAPIPQLPAQQSLHASPRMPAAHVMVEAARGSYPEGTMPRSNSKALSAAHDAPGRGSMDSTPRAGAIDAAVAAAHAAAPKPKSHLMGFNTFNRTVSGKIALQQL